MKSLLNTYILLSVLAAFLPQAWSSVYYPSDLEVPPDAQVSLFTYEDLNFDIPPSNTTYLMTYTESYMNMSMGHDGMIYAFNYYVSSLEPFRISIWRWQFDSGYNSYGYYENYGERNGVYTLVYMTYTIRPTYTGYQTFYISETVHVSQDDFFGITYGERNPIKYDVISGCTNTYDNIESLSPVQVEYYQSDSTYYFQHINPICKKYAISAMMYSYNEYSFNCNLTQITVDLAPFYITSHPGYGATTYENNYSKCWRVRATSSDKVLYIKAVSWDVEEHSSCNYDQLIINSDSPSTYGVDGAFNYGPYCGGSNSLDVLIVDNDEMMLNFITDYSVRQQGFRLEIRSVPRMYYNMYESDSSYQWPWQDGRWTFSTTVTPGYVAVANSTVPVSGAATLLDNWSTLQLIGFGLAVVLVGIVVIVVIAILIYYCCCQSTKNKGKVHPSHGATGLPQNKGYYNGKGGVQASQSQGVYTLPHHGNRLPPLSTTMPSARLNQVPLNPPPPPPYPLQRYMNDLIIANQQPRQPYPQQSSQPLQQQLPPPPPSYRQPSQPLQQQYPPPPPPLRQPSQPVPQPPQPLQPRSLPKYSMGEVAFALRQPKPLKPINSPFGLISSQQPQHKSEEELMQLARARLNWQHNASIPGPAVYAEPTRGVSGGVVAGPAVYREPTGVNQQQRHPANQDSWMYLNGDEF